MIFYLLFIILQGIILYCGYAVRKKINKKILIAVSFFLLFFFAAFRFDVGYDYEHYYTYIDSNQYWKIIRFEPLNQIIFYLAIYLDSPLVAFIIYSFLTYLFIIKAAKINSLNPYITIFLYILLFYIESLCYMRQALAVSIVFYAYRYVKSKEVKKCFLWGFIASLFHYSAIVLIAIYYLYHHGNIKKVLLYSFFVLIAKNFVFTIMANLNLYSSYLDNLEIGGGGFIRFFYIILIIPLYFFKLNKNNEEKSLFTLLFFGLHLPFLFGSHLGMRIANYFFIFLCILIPLYFRRKISYKIFVSLFIVYFTLFLYISSINNKSQYIPYNFYWNKDEVQFRSAFL